MVCSDEEHEARTSRFRDVGEGEASDHRIVYLRPVVRESRTNRSCASNEEIADNSWVCALGGGADEKQHHHHTEEITRVVNRERHTHEVHVHELVRPNPFPPTTHQLKISSLHQPILRPRRIATRVRISIETEVLPERTFAEDGVVPADPNDLAFHLPPPNHSCLQCVPISSFILPRSVSNLASRDHDGTACCCNGLFDGVKCAHPGPYQAYAQRVHERAVKMLEEEVKSVLERFERSLVVSPVR